MGTQLPSPKGACPQLSAHVYCGQMAGWIKMPLGVALGFDPGNFVLDRDPAFPPRKGGGAANFWPMSFMAKRLDGSRCHLAWKWPWSRPHCARRGPSSLPKKGAEPPIFGPCLLWPNGWMDQDATWYGGRPQPRRRGDPAPSPLKVHSPQFSANVRYDQTAGWTKIPLGMDMSRLLEPARTWSQTGSKPNSITLSGRRQVRGWSQTC